MNIFYEIATLRLRCVRNDREQAELAANFTTLPSVHIIATRLLKTLIDRIRGNGAHVDVRD